MFGMTWMSAAAVALALAVLTHPAGAEGLRITGAWAWATPPAAPGAAVYLTIENESPRRERLIAVNSPAARRASLHRSIQEGDIVKMRPAGEIVIAPGATVVLAPGGLHVMLMGLERPLVAGERLELGFRFAEAGLVLVEAEVVAIGTPVESGGSPGHRPHSPGDE